MKKRFWIVLAFFIPIILFGVCAYLNDFIPFGSKILNIYDSNMQYPGIFMQLKNLNLLNFTGGLGHNFLGTMAYYLLSPLNLLIAFFNSSNFYIFYSILIYVKIGLIGLSMYVFLSYISKKNNGNVLLFSIIYALCGFSVTYYYNTMWIDGLYLLPLVMLGIVKLANEKKIGFYIFTLTISIIINFYIGYMIGIFSIIFFGYKYINLETKDKNREILKQFILTTIIAILISSIILLPTFFALKQGKLAGFKSDFNNLFAFNSNFKSVFYNLTPASYQVDNHSYGPPLIYTSLFVIVLNVIYFLNPKFSKKEKISTAIVIGIFFVSFSFNLFDYGWQMFQKPVWWQSRYSFILSAFLTYTAFKSMFFIDYIKLTILEKTILILGLIILLTGSFILTLDNILFLKELAIMQFIVSIILVINYFLIIDNKKLKWLVVLILFAELFLNTFNSVKKNAISSTLKFEQLTINSKQETLNKIVDKDLIRMEFVNKYSSNDGMLFNYNGINYFNSVRNNRFVNFAKNNINLSVDSDCGVILDYFNPYVLSLLNIKYLVDYDIEYFDLNYKNGNLSIFENPYPLSIGFLVNDELRKFKFNNIDINNNIDELFSAITGDEIKSTISINGNFTAKKDYLFINDKKIDSLNINGTSVPVKTTFNLIKTGDKINTNKELTLLDLDEYESVMKKINGNILTMDSMDPFRATINVEDDNQLLMLTIPYDEGIIIKVDNKVVDKELLFDTFIGINLDKGEHVISISYVPQGLVLGAFISFTTLFGTTIYLTRKPKNML